MNLQTAGPNGEALVDDRHLRRRDGGKYESVVRAAVHLFGTRGFDGTSVNAIANAAQVSKATVYAYFNGKYDILLAALEEMLASLPGPRELVLNREGSLGESLRGIARDVCEMVTGPMMKNMYRMVVLSTSLNAHITEQFAAEIFDRYARAIEAFLCIEVGAGRLVITDIPCASAQFLGLAIGRPIFHTVLTGNRWPSVQSLEEHIELAVTFFLTTYAPGGNLPP